MQGELPSVEQREQFVQKVAALRRIPEDVSRLLPEIARLPAASPLSAERIGMSLVSAALQLRPALDCFPQELRDRCLQLCALTPSLITAMHRLRSGRAVIEPAEHLGHAANYLFMLNGEEADGLRAKLERGERIMGFGHAVYRTEDPRSRLLRAVAERLGGPRVELAQHVEERSLQLLRELRPGHELYTNVEFYASIVLEAVGVPTELFTSTFALSRMVGWSAHIMEQLADPRIMRPTARYMGPPPANQALH